MLHLSGYKSHEVGTCWARHNGIDKQSLIWMTASSTRGPVSGRIAHLLSVLTNGGYIDADDRHRNDEKYTVGMIVACHRYLAEMQTDLGDTRGGDGVMPQLGECGWTTGRNCHIQQPEFLYLKALLNRLQEPRMSGRMPSRSRSIAPIATPVL